MYNARTSCCDLASSHGGYKYKSVVPDIALKALLAKQTRSYGETLSTLSDVKIFIVACYHGLLHVVCKVHSKSTLPGVYINTVLRILRLHTLTLPTSWSFHVRYCCAKMPLFFSVGV